MINIEVDSQKGNEFLKEFLELYLSRGFGNMTKREVDVLIFHLLKKYGSLNEKSNHLMAMQLRTTPLKIKSLNYESVLRFPPSEENVFTEEYFKGQLIEYFKKPVFKFRKEDNWIYIQIDNPFLLEAFKAIALNNKEIIDSSFNSEIVKISFEGFILVLRELIEDKKIVEIDKLLKTKYKEKLLTFPKITKMVMTEIVKKGISEAPKKISELTNWILNGDANQFVSNILEIVKP
jgi:hypothetical protein